MSAKRLLSCCLCAALSIHSVARAGIFDSLKELISPGSAPGGGAAPSTGEVSRGLLEALNVGAERAVASASRRDGFLGNPRIRIPLPHNVQAVAKGLREVGLGQRVDDFETTLNRGAEAASAKALPIFKDCIKGLTFEDVQRIWKGPDDAATSYLREKGREKLFEAFLPVVHATSQEVGVTRAYEEITSNSVAEMLLGGSDLDLDRYVTNKALDGVFTLLADEEKQIRTNPVARTTDLLKKVFSR